MIFVFGSNLSGIHGAGAAAVALDKHHAEWGVGEGLTGNSYALPTKGVRITFMPLEEVIKHIRKFVEFANTHPELEFQVTRVGCGLAGFKDREIAPHFQFTKDNCLFDNVWKPVLGPKKRY